MKTKHVFLVVVLIAMHVRLFAGSATDPGLIAHEWGTFTSVQGADGVQLQWNPLVTSELPKFVYDRGRPTGNPALARYSAYAGKGALVALQRMETPVIYFYSAKEQKVDVSVQFPQGVVTEWFPQVAKYDPRLMRWDGITVLPNEANPGLANLLPMDTSASHYFAARETDADFLRSGSNTVRKGAKTEHEKFLFYRGVGHFKAPLQATLGPTDDIVILKNAGLETLSDLYVLYVHHGQSKFLYVDKLAAGAERTVNLLLQNGQRDLSTVRTGLAKQMASSLARHGLFAREASAMVKTWDDSWFGEEGLRVLYTLPRQWTDRTLPLQISPAPSQIVRVMVGRAEMITPSMEWDLMKQITRYGDQDSQAKEQAVANARAVGLGRFTEAAVRRLVNRVPNREFSQAAWNLLNELGKPAGNKLALAK